jgi:hypothetical protein
MCMLILHYHVYKIFIKNYMKNFKKDFHKFSKILCSAFYLCNFLFFTVLQVASLNFTVKYFRGNAIFIVDYLLSMFIYLILSFFFLLLSFLILLILGYMHIQIVSRIHPSFNILYNILYYSTSYHYSLSSK